MRILSIRLFILCACLLNTRVHAGYTHYFTWHKTPDQAELKKCINEMQLLIQARTNILIGPHGPGTMIVDSTHVDLNGIGDNACEPFVFPGDLGFNFCKTEAMPYDEVVTACLLVARDHFPSSELSIASDGDWAAGDWDNGKKLYASVLGRTPPYPISPTWQVIGRRQTIRGYALMALALGLTFPITLVLLLRKLFRKR